MSRSPLFYATGKIVILKTDISLHKIIPVYSTFPIHAVGITEQYWWDEIELLLLLLVHDVVSYKLISS